jgi:hypothetical protein
MPEAGQALLAGLPAAGSYREFKHQLVPPGRQSLNPTPSIHAGNDVLSPARPGGNAANPDLRLGKTALGDTKFGLCLGSVGRGIGRGQFFGRS